MGMDEVSEGMERFQRALETFNDAVKSSMNEIEQHNDRLGPMWQDSMRISYNERWAPLEDELRNFRDHVGPRYLETMIERSKFLRRYLNGN